MRPLCRKAAISAMVSLLGTSAISCFPCKRLTVANVGMILEDVNKASAKQTDLNIVREGTPAYLMLLDGLIEAYPKEKRLLLAGAQAYSSYAAAFGDPESPEATAALFLKGREYALRAMPREQKFRAVLSQPYEALESYVGEFSRKDVPVLFWFASCWAGWIGVSTESVEAIADLPKVILLMERVLELDETYYYGGAHLFMGVYKSAKPKAYGGEPEAARDHFERALEIGKGDFLMAYVYYADNYARKIFQRELFVSLLERVLASPADSIPELTLINTLAKIRAQDLLDDVEEYF